MKTKIYIFLLVFGLLNIAHGLGNPSGFNDENLFIMGGMAVIGLAIIFKHGNK
jgi:hypothetical protein